MSKKTTSKTDEQEIKKSKVGKAIKKAISEAEKHKVRLIPIEIYPASWVEKCPICDRKVLLAECEKCIAHGCWVGGYAEGKRKVICFFQK